MDIFNDNNYKSKGEKMKKKASDISKYVEALEKMVNEDTNNQEKTTEEIVKMLVKALADEWLAAYQYWVCKNLSRGQGKTDADQEFDQHFQEELAHADKLMFRIKELGGKPIFNPEEWLVLGNPWVEVTTSNVKEQLAITIKAEKDAIAYYESIIQYVRGFDEVTLKVIREILSDETEHAYDLEMLFEEMN